MANHVLLTALPSQVSSFSRGSRAFLTCNSESLPDSQYTNGTQPLGIEALLKYLHMLIKIMSVPKG